MVEYDSLAAIISMYDSPIITAIARFIDLFTYPLIFIFLAYLFFVKKERKRVIVIAITYMLLLFLIPALKSVFGEVRPCSAQWKINCPTDYGLPSGHAAVGAVLVIAYLITPAFSLALLAYVIISLSRIYLGVHVFKDILAGTAIAFIVFLLVEKFFSSKLGAYFQKGYKSIHKFRHRQKNRRRNEIK